MTGLRNMKPCKSCNKTRQNRMLLYKHTEMELLVLKTLIHLFLFSKLFILIKVKENHCSISGTLGHC